MAERSRGGAKKAEAGVQESVKTAAVGVGGAGQNEGMKRTPLFVLALAVIPGGLDAQVTPSVSCAELVRRRSRIGVPAPSRGMR